MLTNIKNHLSHIALASLLLLCLAANVNTAMDDIRSAEVQEVAHGSY